MKQEDQIVAFAGDLDILISRYEREFELNTMAACGVLMMKIRMLQDGAIEGSQE